MIYHHLPYQSRVLFYSLVHFTLVTQQYLMEIPSIQCLLVYFILFNVCIIFRECASSYSFCFHFLLPLTTLQNTSLNIKKKKKSLRCPRSRKLLTVATVAGMLRASAKVSFWELRFGICTIRGSD